MWSKPRQHYQRAAKLDPKNETYRSSCQIAAGAAQGGPASAAAARSSGTVSKASRNEPVSLDKPRPEPRQRQSSTSNGEESVPASEIFYRLESTLSEGDTTGARATRLTILRRPIRITCRIGSKRPSSHCVINGLIWPAKSLPPLQSASPQSAEAQRLLGTAQYRQGRYSAAQSAFATALSLDNTAGLSYFLMGCTLRKLGQQDAAATHFARAAELDPRFASAVGNL